MSLRYEPYTPSNAPRCDLKSAERAEIDEQVAEFLARGGEITEVPCGASKHNPEFVTGSDGIPRYKSGYDYNRSKFNGALTRG